MTARTVAVIGFIAVVFGFAIYLAQRPTVIRGDVLAHDMMGELRAKGIATVAAIACDDEIPFGANGARFQCRFGGVDGSSETWEYTMSREGALDSHQLGATPATKRR